MNLWQFLYSRLVFIVAYIGFGAIATLIVQLDLWLAGSQLARANLLYIWLLAGIILAVALWVDYIRWAAYLRRLRHLSEAQALDDLAVLPPPRTYEQTIFSAAWAAIYARLHATASQERLRGHRNLEIVSQWAHHMKTPISIIDLELQKVQNEKLLAEPNPQLSRALTSVEEENQRLHHTLQSLLNMVRLEEFSADFNVVSLDLIDLLRSVLNDHKRDFIVHRVYPKFEQPSATQAPVHVFSDAKWLRFVLEQVLSNAVKYAAHQEREGRITFSCRRADNSTVLEVADNGIGISSQDISRVFNPFFTGETGRTHPNSTGMGLYLARETCHRLGHSIQIASQPGVGTQVTITFPDHPTTFQGLYDR